jgi:hypothetical protein
MTTLDKRGVRRETNALDPINRRKVLVVTLEVGGKLLRIKVKGDRSWYAVPFEEIYRMGCRIRAQQLKVERLALDAIEAGIAATGDNLP